MIYYIQYLESNQIIPFVLAYILAIVVAMSVHEYAHARVAYAFGDDTAYLSGRLTLNPLAHINMLGFICFLLLGYGWATPVPVNSLKFKNKKYKLGMFCVSIAGVITNICLAFFLCGIYIITLQKINIGNNTSVMYFLNFFSEVGVSMNIYLFFFNLIPIPPLDGFNALNSIIKSPVNKVYRFLKNYGFQIFLLIIVVTNILGINLLGYLAKFVLGSFLEFWLKVIC